MMLCSALRGSKSTVAQMAPLPLRMGPEGAVRVQRHAAVSSYIPLRPFPLTPSSFWDWEQPDQGLIDSDFFHPVHGFGGVSDNKAPYELSEKGVPLWDNKHCIGKNGPFESLNPQWYGVFDGKAIFNPHCLTRVFNDQFYEPKEDHMIEGVKFDLKGAPKMQKLYYGKEGVAKLLAMTDYNEFNLACEDLHTWAARALMGEYLTLQAPNGMCFPTYIHSLPCRLC